MTGFDVGFVNSCSGGLSGGVQWAFVGINNGSFNGWQNAFVSITGENFEGLQIGLMNLIDTGGAFPVFPIVNWSFSPPSTFECPPPTVAGWRALVSAIGHLKDRRERLHR